jgi:transposase InsO family protein
VNPHHPQARLTVAGRQLAVARVRAGVPVVQVATALGVSRQTVYKWLRRAASASPEWTDRSSRPRRSPTRLPRHRRRQIERARRRRWSSPRIAQHLQLPLSTVVTHVRRVGLARLPALAPPPLVRRYERAYPGELVHLDVKKLGRIGRVGHRIHGDRRTRVRGIGWEYVHVAIDDHSRLAYVEVLPDETGATAAGFLQRATAWYATLGIPVERVLTDNGGCYRSLPFASTALALGIGQRFTAPYRPQTNGKAERFIRTLLAEWAYARPYRHSHERRRALAAGPHLLQLRTTSRGAAICPTRQPAPHVPVNNVLVNYT